MNENSESRGKGQRFSVEQRRELLAGFRQRQGAAEDYARTHGVAASTLHRWVKAEAEAMGQQARPLEFHEVHVDRPVVGSWAGEISLPNGTTMRWNGTAGVTGIEQLLPQLRRSC